MAPSAKRSRSRSARITRWLSIAFVLALHGALVYAAMQVEVVRQSVAQAMPLFVEYITPPKVIQPEEPVKPPPPPPPPQIKPLPLKRPPPIMVSKRVHSEPAPVFTAPPPPVVAEPLPPIAEPPPPPVAVAAPPAPPAPPPITQPLYNAAYLNNPPPDYPPMSRRRGETGKVLVRVYVAPDGHPEKVELNRSSGSQNLDRAALDAVSSWRFVPAKQGDHAVAAWVLVPIAFQLEG